VKRTLLPYQKRWVQDRAPLKVIEKSRRIGISWAEAYDAVMHAAEGKGNVYYQSYSQEMTRTFISDCADWAEYLNKGAGAVGEELLADGDRSVQTFRIAMASGKEIYAMPASPRIFRSKGKPGDIAVIDEAAFLDDLDESLKAALAFTVWGGSAHIISTHNGEASPFAALARDIREDVRPGSQHTVAFKQALAEGLYKRVCEAAGRTWSQEAETAWEAGLRAEYGVHAAEELDCIPSAGAGAWLAWELIRAAGDKNAGKPEMFSNGPAFIGIDVARRRDLWVAAVLEKVGDVLWLRELRAERDIPFSKQRAVVRELVGRYRPVRISVDQTGMGEAVVEQYQDDHGSLRIEGVLMTGPRRLNVATALREAMEDRAIRIPKDDDLRRDLHSVRAEAGPTGGARLIAERAGTDGHADRFWACALACAAAAGASGPLEVWTDGQRFAALDFPGETGGEYTIDRELGVVRSPLAALDSWR